MNPFVSSSAPVILTLVASVAGWLLSELYTTLTDVHFIAYEIRIDSDKNDNETINAYIELENLSHTKGLLKLQLRIWCNPTLQEHKESCFVSRDNNLPRYTSDIVSMRVAGDKGDGIVKPDTAVHQVNLPAGSSVLYKVQQTVDEKPVIEILPVDFKGEGRFVVKEKNSVEAKILRNFTTVTVWVFVLFAFLLFLYCIFALFSFLAGVYLKFTKGKSESDQEGNMKYNVTVSKQ